MIYKFKQGATCQGIDAQTAGDELERIRSANDGKLLTRDVVHRAADPDSPIHKAFTWDNERAADAYRLSEARDLIRSIVVVGTFDEAPQPAFWNVSIAITPPDAEGPSVEHYYQAAAVIARSPYEFNAALAGMLRELASAQKGLEQLRRLAPHSRQKLIIRVADQVRSAQQELGLLVVGT